MNKEEILKEMEKVMEQNNLAPTKNIDKIANAKSIMSPNNWKKCPCDANNENRYCISPLCLKDIKENGICHCHCYQLKKEE